MSEITLRVVAYYVFYYVMQWGAGVAAAVLTFTAAQTADRWTGAWYAPDIITWAQQHRFVIFAMSACVVVGKFACATMGAPWAWASIRRILTRWRHELFPSTPDNEHRITLFKYTSRWIALRNWSAFKALRERGPLYRMSTWPDAWFRPVARSGEVAQKGISWFPYLGRGGVDEVVIGKVWKSGDGMSVSGLPDLNGAGNEQEYKTYAENAGVTVDWLKRRRQRGLPRSLGGIRIERDGGRLWGVLIVDSRHDKLVLTRSELKLAAVALEEFIKHA